MFYPVYVHHEPGAAYGITIPDLPGVFSAADEAADIPRMVQEAVEAMYEGESAGPGPASPLERYSQSDEYTGGFWMLIDVDLSKLSTRAVRLNISLPEYLVGRIDEAAALRRMSRSAYLALAAEHELGGVASRNQGGSKEPPASLTS